MALEILGLTKNETKAYETLLRLGKTTAAHISKESAVPYGRIYTVLDSLEEKGLVRVIPEPTKHYAPASPQILQEFLSKQKEQFSEAEKYIEEYKALYESHEAEAVQIAKGKKTFYKLLQGMQKPKKTSYSIKYSFELIPQSLREAKDYKKQAIDYKVLGRWDKETENNIRTWKNIAPNIKPIHNTGVAVSIIDDEEILLVLIKSNMTLLIKDKPFVELMKTFFLHYYTTT